MLVWINGPFGGGKTQTAHELRRRLPGSVLSDPEVAGVGLHRMLPRELRSDFQDLPAWRQGVFEVLDLLLREQDGVVVVPMTLVEPKYFAEIVGELRDRGHDVRHFALLAERETVLRRLSERAVLHSVRGLPPDHENFAVSKLDLCLERLSGAEFGEHIQTDRLTVAQVADRIAGSAGLSLEPNTDSALRGYVRRKWTSVKHIRFG